MGEGDYQMKTKTIDIPVLGYIYAGPPLPSPSSEYSFVDKDSIIEITKSMLLNSSRGDYFALEVRGDGLLGSMIKDGDIVVLLQTDKAKDGDIVAVWFPNKNETSLAHYSMEREEISLRWSNPFLNPFKATVDNPFQIQGIVVLLISFWCKTRT
jgi:repressor LexA